MQKYNKTPLIAGMRCLIIASKTKAHLGREVILVRTYELNGGRTYWETSPQLIRIAEDGERKVVGLTSGCFLALDEPKIHGELTIERREDCKADPRMAGYILGKEAAYNWKQNNPGASAG
jgi:hypothetical protein